ncbi:MAG TPA: sugar phosphate isomerase/epimerase family protein [Candidatus Brocadiia bacterium]|nr:sugar phosphate isomerase/epimerase family protein [Candidatus Brocadiia bacterium]
MPKFAVMTFMFKPWLRDNRITHEKMLAGFAAAGAQGIEPFHRDFIEDPNLLKTYPKLLKDNGLCAPVVDVMCNLVYADETQKRQSQDDLNRGLEVCHALGTVIAHVAGHRLVPGVAPADGRKMIADRLAQAAASPAGKGLIFAIEDFNPSPDLVCSAKDCLEIMDLSGGVVRMVFDTGNFIAVKERADQIFDLVADRITHCHFKDFITDPAAKAGYRSCDMGQGEIPNRAIARKLVARGYDGWVSLETYGRAEVDPVTAVRSELPVLKSWFAA